VKYGKKITIYLGVGAIIITVISSLCIRDLVILFSSILITPFFIKTLYRQSTSNVLSTNKYAILFLSLIICFRYPLYLFVCTFVYFLSKWYFKNRFNISYPSLKI
jgi:hypothetical protein